MIPFDNPIERFFQNLSDPRKCLFSEEWRLELFCLLIKLLDVVTACGFIVNLIRHERKPGFVIVLMLLEQVKDNIFMVEEYRDDVISLLPLSMVHD
jgi:hypothetical protein